MDKKQKTHNAPAPADQEMDRLRKLLMGGALEKMELRLSFLEGEVAQKLESLSALLADYKKDYLEGLSERILELEEKSGVPGIDIKKLIVQELDSNSSALKDLSLIHI